MMRIKHSLKRELYHEKAMDLYFKEGICGTHICKIMPTSRATKNHGCINSNILHRKIYLIYFDVKIIATFVP